MSNTITVTVVPSTVSVAAGSWYNNAYASISGANCCEVIWESADTSIATVNIGSGQIYGVSEGTVRIYAKLRKNERIFGYCDVTVTRQIPVESLTLSRTSLVMKPSNEYTLAATICPSSATNKSMSITSDNTDVAAVFGLTVYSRAVGTATITVRTTDGSNKEARCSVTVTNEIPVSGITISPSQKTITEGNSTCVTPSVTPSNATNKCVTWSSDNTNVATVHPTSGVITGLREGTARIYATACDGSGVSGYCTVTVNPLVHVSSVSLCPRSLTVYVGKTAHLYETVCPENASEKSVRWTSSNPDVATVNAYSGLIRAVSPGVSDITVTTIDGGYSDTVTVKVLIDAVTVEKDGDLSKVVFKSTGKTWYCINHDMIFDEDNVNNTSLGERVKLNYLENPENNQVIRTYSDEEIKLLYLIDPYGVARYIRDYADNIIGGDVKEIVEYKDNIFRMLFNTEPRYFARNCDGEWYITNNTCKIGEVISESETLFGMHPLYDMNTYINILDLAIDIILACFDFLPFNNASTLKIALSLIFSLGESVLEHDIMNFGSTAVQIGMDALELDWLSTIISMGDAFEEWADHFDLQPNYYRKLAYCYSYETDYNVYLKLNNGRICHMEEIYEAFN